MKTGKLFKTLVAAILGVALFNSCGKLVLGGYTVQRAITDEEIALFETVYNSSVEGYVPLTPKTVATQVVAGTNYRFICKDGNNKKYEVIIYKPAAGLGDPELTSFGKI